MTATILDGRKIRDEGISRLKQAFSGLSFVPTLAIIQVGNREDTSAYVRAKIAFAEKIGVKVNHIKLEETIEQPKLVEEIQKLNNDESVKGIIVQFPLPSQINKDFIADQILSTKDVDAITAVSIKNWTNGVTNSLLPATAKGVQTLLHFYGIKLYGKKVTMIGRSILVGKPIASMCLNENATVTICHSKTTDLKKETKDADIVIVAVGKPNLITKDHVKEGQVIIDVGINTLEGKKLDDEIPERKIVGDVDFEEVSQIVGAITPVPGGVGPLTVLSVFENLLVLCTKMK